MSSHLQGHGVASTIDHEPGTNSTLVGTEAAAIVEKAFGTTAAADVIVQRKGDAQITVPSSPTIDTDAASKGYVDQQVVSGNTWKEILLAPEQLLNGGSGGVLQGILATIATNLAATDTFILTDGTTTETWTAVAGAPAAFQFQVGGSAGATLTNLVAAINADSTLWSAVETSGLDAYFSGAEATQFVVYRTATSSNPDRAYGVIGGGQSGLQVVAFNAGDQDYRQQSGTQTDLPAADPTAKRFGFGRVFGGLNGGDTHRIADDNTAFTWDSDDTIWQQTATGSAILEGDGIDITSNKVTTDVATATVARKYGGLTNRALSDGSALGAAADAGFNAVITDDVDLNVNSSDEVSIKAQSRLDRVRTIGTWTSSTAPDKTPTLAELQAALGTAAADIGNFGIIEEDGTAVGSDSSFFVHKRANAGALTDYVGVELSSF